MQKETVEKGVPREIEMGKWSLSRESEFTHHVQIGIRWEETKVKSRAAEL